MNGDLCYRQSPFYSLGRGYAIKKIEIAPPMDFWRFRPPKSMLAGISSQLEHYLSKIHALRWIFEVKLGGVGDSIVFEALAGGPDRV